MTRPRNPGLALFALGLMTAGSTAAQGVAEWDVPLPDGMAGQIALTDPAEGATQGVLVKSTQGLPPANPQLLDDWVLDLGVSAGIGSTWVPSVDFTRLESGGTITDRGFGIDDADVTTTHFGAQGAFNLGRVWDGPFQRITFGAQYFGGEETHTAMLIQAPNPYQLALNDGEGSGFFFFPGFSDLYDVRQTNEVRGHGYNLGLGGRLPTFMRGDSVGDQVDPFGFGYTVSVRYAGIEQTQDFWAVTNGNTLPFWQKTEIDQDSYGVGLDLSYGFRMPNEFLPGLYAKLGGGASVNRHDTEAMGVLDVQGFAPRYFEADDKATKIDWNVGLDLGVRSGRMDLSIGYRFENFAIGEVKFPDADPATVGMDRGKTHRFQLGLKYRFGGGMTSIDPPTLLR